VHWENVGWEGHGKSGHHGLAMTLHGEAHHHSAPHIPELIILPRLPGIGVVAESGLLVS
jgi:hypothetical protein